MCRRVLVLTICMVSLWGQLTSASSHRSHIGTASPVLLDTLLTEDSFKTNEKQTQGPQQQTDNRRNHPSVHVFLIFLKLGCSRHFVLF